MATWIQKRRARRYKKPLAFEKPACCNSCAHERPCESECAKATIGRAYVGDLMCDADVDKFKKECKIPLFPNQWNTWIINRTLADNPSGEDRKQLTKNVFYHWFKAVDAGEADEVTVTDLTDDSKPSNDPFGQQDDAKRNELVKNLKKRAKRGECAPVPTVKGPETTQLAVQFVYRGSKKEMPWPVHKAQIFNPWCPVNADYAVEEVFTGVDKDFKGKPPPKEKPPWWRDPKIPSLPPGPQFKIAGVVIGVVFVAAFGYGLSQRPLRP